MRVAAVFVVSIFVILPAAAVAAPVRFQLLGDVEAVYSFLFTGLPVPPSMVQGAPVAIDLVFEPVVLRYPAPNGVQPIPDIVLAGDWEPHYVPSAESAILELIDGAITIGEESFHWSDGKLFVTDNKAGGLCVGFNCKSWTSDTIDLIARGEATKLGNGVRFSTLGGLSSPQHASDFPPNNTLTVGSNLADIATWSRFPNGSLYIRFRSEDGSRHADVTIQLTDVIAVAEPQSLILAIILTVMATARFDCRKLHAPN